MSKQFTSDDVLAVIRARVVGSTQTAVAAELGVSVSLLSRILAGERGISDEIAEAFGFEREVTTTVTFRKKAA